MPWMILISRYQRWNDGPKGVSQHKNKKTKKNNKGEVNRGED